MELLEQNKLFLHNCDNMEYMAKIPDKYFDWICIDPPYGLGKRLSDGGGKLKDTPMRKLYKTKDWDILPSESFFKEVFRVSNNQIVFGANYFLEYLPSSRGFVCWDKKQAMPTLSACELVWTSLDKPAKIMTYSSTDLQRFHPTQKPIDVYKFMFNYCKLKPNDKIFDSHLGSMSSVIAAYEMGFEIHGCELDKEYYDAGKNRVITHLRQLKLF
jgi:site-specific DNA-methyltransferase (adenine-specific)